MDSGPQPQPQKGVQVGGRTLAGTQPSFLIWYTNEWTGLRPYLGISGGLTLGFNITCQNSTLLMFVEF